MKLAEIARPTRCYLFFQPPRCPGAPPLERGLGPNSGPDCRESMGWITLLVLPKGFFGSAASGRKGRDSGPCISSRWGLWTLEVLLALPLPLTPPRAARDPESELC